jgi:hypothetical protein
VLSTPKGLRPDPAEYMSAEDLSAIPVPDLRFPVTAQGGDTVSGLLGTSNPVAIEAFMRVRPFRRALRKAVRGTLAETISPT